MGTVLMVPSPQSTTAVCTSAVSGSVNGDVSSTVSPGLASPHPGELLDTDVITGPVLPELTTFTVTSSYMISPPCSRMLVMLPRGWPVVSMKVQPVAPCPGISRIGDACVGGADSFRDR